MKKSVKCVKAIALFMAMLMSALLFTACGGNPVSVKIVDMGETVVADGTDNMTVAELLETAEVKLGEKDEAEPSLDTKWSEADAEQITVKRYAKVTVVNGNEKKTVELVGGTVEDAVKEAGYSFDDGIVVDFENDKFLEDGMTITVSTSISVKVTVDGKTNAYKTTAQTVKELLSLNNITLGKDDEISEKTDSKLTDGMEIIIKRVEYKEEKTTEDIDYDTETTYDDSIASGESKTIQSGVNGKKEITYKVKYVDGKEESREKVSEKINSDPVNEIIAQGTKTESAAPQAPQNNAGGKTVVSKQKVLDCDGSGHGYYIITYSDGTEEYEDF